MMKAPEFWMQHALRLAERAAHNGEVPVGAVLVLEDAIIGEGWNQSIAARDPTAHAEIIALRQAARRIDNYRILNSTLYVTLEPCMMCAGAMVHARISNLMFGAADPRTGAVNSVFRVVDDPRLNHRIHWQGGVLADACAQPLKAFFQARR